MAPLGTLEDFSDPLAASDCPSRGTGPCRAAVPRLNPSWPDREAGPGQDSPDAFGFAGGYHDTGGVQLAFSYVLDGEVDCAGASQTWIATP
ncbi:hypothetical protein GCM10027074_70140 [Streptomyces deserti]